MNQADIRDLSSSVFNNGKFVEVVLALDRWGESTVTAQQLATQLRLNHDLVKKVLVRLSSASLVKSQERIGGKRGALPYEVQRGLEWNALVALATALAGEGTAGATDRRSPGPAIIR